MEYEVLFDGTAHRPWGRYLKCEPEAPPEPTERSFRQIKDLSHAEVKSLLDEAMVEPALMVAQRYHVSRATVVHLLAAYVGGYLREQAS
jgi:hypothetical protein